MSNQHRFIWVDFIRIVGAFAVIIIHLSAEIIVDYASTGTLSWWYANSINSASRWAVPVFIMISGYLLLNPKKQEDLTIFFKKRFSKIGIPLIAWTVIYLLWSYFMYNVPLSKDVVFGKIILGNPYYHLYFLFIMIGLYLITPILKVYLAHVDRKNLTYFLVLTLSLPIIIIFLNQWYAPAYIHTNSFTYFLSYIGYFVLGYYLKTVELKGKQLLGAVVCLLLTIAITAIGTYFLSVHGSESEALYMYSYFSPNVFVMSLLIFIVFKSWNNIITPFSKVFSLIAPATFGIYLIHPMVINVLQHGAFGYSITVHSINRIVGLTATTVIVFILSFVVVYIFRKIPFIQKIFG